MYPKGTVGLQFCGRLWSLVHSFSSDSVVTASSDPLMVHGPIYMSRGVQLESVCSAQSHPVTVGTAGHWTSSMVIVSIQNMSYIPSRVTVGLEPGHRALRPALTHPHCCYTTPLVPLPLPFTKP